MGQSAGKKKRVGAKKKEMFVFYLGPSHGEQQDFMGQSLTLYNSEFVPWQSNCLAYGFVCVWEGMDKENKLVNIHTLETDRCIYISIYI